MWFKRKKKDSQPSSEQAAPSTATADVVVNREGSTFTVKYFRTTDHVGEYWLYTGEVALKWS